jgi:hypothetical protein
MNFYILKYIAFSESVHIYWDDLYHLSFFRKFNKKINLESDSIHIGISLRTAHAIQPTAEQGAD